MSEVEVKEKAIVSSVVSMCDCSNTALRLKEHIKKREQTIKNTAEKRDL